MYILNDQLAVTPFAKDYVAKKHVGQGVIVPEQFFELAALKVVYGNNEIPQGSTIYVKASDCRSDWASRRYSVNGGAEFILIHKGNVIGVDYPAPTNTATTSTYPAAITMYPVP